MYSGTILRTKSGRLMGVHQKIDRVARRHIKRHIPKGMHFPTTHEVLHFEGLNGPDGIKRKSPGHDEPWHYIDPTNPDDKKLVVMIMDHVENLSVALRDNNRERAAFEAAWMAHAITDGLTPAHHYPLDDKIEELWGKPKEERLTIRDKNIIKGKNRRDTISKNWEYWGTSGVFTNHFMFEWGVGTSIVSSSFDDIGLTQADLERVENTPFEDIFDDALRRVVSMKMYDEFSRLGWTRHLAIETREELIPEIIKTVVLGWYAAVVKAKK